MLKQDLLILNSFGLDTNFAPNQGKGFPTANPMTSVGSTNKFARRAILRRAETKTFVKGENANSTQIVSVIIDLSKLYNNYKKIVLYLYIL